MARLLGIAISLYLGFNFWPSEIFIFGANDNPQFFVALWEFLFLVLTDNPRFFVALQDFLFLVLTNRGGFNDYTLRLLVGRYYQLADNVRVAP